MKSADRLRTTKQKTKQPGTWSSSQAEKHMQRPLAPAVQLCPSHHVAVLATGTRKAGR